MIFNLLMSLVLGGPAFFLSLIEGHPIAPGIPSASTAVDKLAQLVVAPQGPQQGYSRAKFPHWITQQGYSIPPVYLMCASQSNAV